VIATIRDGEDNSLIDVAVLSNHATLSKDLIVHAGSALSHEMLNQALCSAVTVDNPELLKKLYQFVDSLYRSVYDEGTYEGHHRNLGWSALEEACERGHEHIVRAILELNDIIGTAYALKQAWVRGHLRVVDILIEAGATAHLDPTGRFAVDVMCQSHEMLLEKSLDEKKRNELINHLAVREAEMPEPGDRVEEDEEDEDNFNIYERIGAMGTEQLARYYIQSREEEHEEHDIHNAMIEAAYGGNVATFQYFLAFAQVHAFSEEAQHHFDLALRSSCRGIAERLFVAYNINMDYSGPVVDDRDQRLVFAAESDSIILLFTILRCPGQDVNCVVKFEWPHVSDACTALSRASDPATIRFLLDAKADVNPEGCDTVLRGACEKLRPDAVKMLLAAGADVNRRSGNDKASSALYYAVYVKCSAGHISDKIEVINLLLEAGADMRDCGGGKSVLHLDEPSEYSSYQLQAVFAALLAYDPGLVHCRDASGATPLLRVLIRHKDPALVKVLLDAKADVDVMDNDGNTALSQLITKRCDISFNRTNIRRICQQLVGAGADLTLCRESMETPLMMLMPRCQEAPMEHLFDVCVENGPTAGHGILLDILDGILYRPVAGGDSDMLD
jgi:ankyrin repeat protein